MRKLPCEITVPVSESTSLTVTWKLSSTSDTLPVRNTLTPACLPALMILFSSTMPVIESSISFMRSERVSLSTRKNTWLCVIVPLIMSRIVVPSPASFASADSSEKGKTQIPRFIPAEGYFLRYSVTILSMVSAASASTDIAGSPEASPVKNAPHIIAVIIILFIVPPDYTYQHHCLNSWLGTNAYVNYYLSGGIYNKGNARLYRARAAGCKKVC